MSENTLNDNSGQASGGLRTAATDALKQVGDKLSDSYEAAKGRVVDASQIVADQSRAAADSVDTFVQENPWRAVGIAAGVGFIIGVLVSRR